MRESVHWCGRGDLNPHAFRRHPLKMVCLPVPPLPHGCETNTTGAVSIITVIRSNQRTSGGHASRTSMFLPIVQRSSEDGDQNPSRPTAAASPPVQVQLEAARAVKAPPAVAV